MGYCVHQVLAFVAALLLVGVVVSQEEQAAVTNPNGPPLPTIPEVFGAEIEFTMANLSFTFAEYELRNAKKNKTKMLFRFHDTPEEVIIDWNTGEEFIIDKKRGCKLTNVERYVYPLTNALWLLNHPSVRYAGEDNVRGIATNVWKAENIQVHQGKLEGLLHAKYYFSQPNWNVLFTTGPQLVQVDLSGTLTNANFTDFSVLMTVVDVSPSRALADDTFDIPEECTETPAPVKANGTVPSNVTEEQPNPHPMPDLPESFSAVIETNMRDLRETFTMYQWFSQPLAASRTSWVRPDLDLFERQVRHDVFLIGTFQLAYELVSNIVPRGHDSLFNANERRMFFPDSAACSKNVFNIELVGSTNDILLRSVAPRARYMGRTVIRGIPAQYWQSAPESGSFRVSWYFAEEHWKYSSANKSVLLRMVISGEGRSPLFVHHPFSLHGEAVSQSMKPACGLFMDGKLVHCEEGEQFYQHVHEFVSFTHGVDDDVFRLPSQCLSLSDINAVPYASNCNTGPSEFSIFVLCVVVAALSVLATLAYQYFKRKKTAPAQTVQAAAVNYQ